MENWLQRTESLLGKQAISRLKNARVIVFGMGGVGGYCVEALARTGIGTLGLVDHDRYSLSNLNRQIFATQTTIGELKVEAAQKRILDINPAAITHAYPIMYCNETAQQIPLKNYDYIVDAIDTVSSKILLVQAAEAANVPIISCMGAGNKLNPMAFKVDDINKTSVCPLAKAIRKQLKDLGVKALKVVYSSETPLIACRPPASNAFVPAAAGLLLASEVTKDLTQTQSVL